MTIDEAINILSDHAYRGVVTLDQKFKDAEKLGILALNRLKAARANMERISEPLLPGETEN